MSGTGNVTNDVESYGWFDIEKLSGLPNAQITEAVNRLM